MRRHTCTLCRRYHPVPGTTPTADECPGLSCCTDALKRSAAEGLAPEEER